MGDRATSGRAGLALVAAYLVVAAATLLAYAGAGRLGFVSFDDRGYVTENATVQEGLGANALSYAFESNVLSNWHPLTWLSHMATVEWFGMEPAAHHWVNVGLHLACALALLAVLNAATRSPVRSALVALLFAVHPLHVESVAWVAERKDVLSTLFWLLATWAWIGWTRSSRIGLYVLSCALLALGLMSKAMLVTLPFTLLLLDGWPLGRWRGVRGGERSARALVLEKLPLFALVAAFCVITFQIQQSSGAVGSTQTFPLGQRFANALSAAVIYLRQTFVPLDLAVFYPYPRELGAGAAGGAAVVLLGLSGLAWFLRKRAPAVLVGWLWFLGTLVPVIGLVQVGAQSHADRYTYVPHIGLFVALVWGGGKLADARAALRVPLLGIALAAVCVMVPMTRAQVAHWEDDKALFGHALEVTEDNYLAHDFYGKQLRAAGDLAGAMEHYREALRIRPEYANAHVSLGVCYMDQGAFSSAIESFQTALRYAPEQSMAWANLAAVYGGTGRLDESLEASRRALAINPDDASAHANAAVTCLALRRVGDALGHFRRSFELNPAARLQPVALEYAWALATTHDDALRDGPEAERAARAFCENVGYRNLLGLEALAAGLAESGRFEEALHIAQQALRGLEAAGRADRAVRMRGHLENLRAGKPLRSSERLIGG